MASRSEIKAIKARRYVFDSDWDEPDLFYGHLQRVPSGPHVPNSNEAKVLRRLMAQTGLNEEELRTHKCYRIELAEAQKKQGTKGRLQRFARKVLKQVTRELKLPKEHPQVKESFISQWNTRYAARNRIITSERVTPDSAWLAAQAK